MSLFKQPARPTTYALVAYCLLGLAQPLGADELPLVAPKPRVAEGPKPAAPVTAELPKSWMEDVEVIPKTSYGLREEEFTPYFKILAHIRKLSAEQLLEAERAFRLERIDNYVRRIEELHAEEAEKNPQTADERRAARMKLADEFRAEPFKYPLVVDAFNRPSDCAGHIVSFSGHVRLVKKLPVTENAEGIGDRYELWLFDTESKGKPVCVVCTELPAGFPINLDQDDVINGVTARGYLFKMYAYTGQEEMQAVPLILAHNVSWTPIVHEPFEMPAWAYGVLGLIGLLLLYLVVRPRKPDPQFQQVKDRISPLDDNPFANLPEETSEDGFPTR